MQKKEKPTDKYLLDSLSRALNTLEYIAENSYSTLTQISQATGDNKTVVYRQLYTMQKHGFVDKTNAGAYVLGHRLVFLGQSALKQNILHQQVKGVLQALTNRFNETSHLGILNDSSQVLIVSKVNSEASIQMTSEIGRTLDAYCSAMGKVLLAFSSKEFLNRYFSVQPITFHTPNTLTSREELVKEFEEISRNGYAFDNQESEEGLFCIAVPVCNRAGRVYAAVSLSGPSSRMQTKTEEIIKSLKEAALKIPKLTDSLNMSQ